MWYWFTITNVPSITPRTSPPSKALYAIAALPCRAAKIAPVAAPLAIVFNGSSRWRDHIIVHSQEENARPQAAKLTPWERGFKCVTKSLVEILSPPENSGKFQNSTDDSKNEKINLKFSPISNRVIPWRPDPTIWPGSLQSSGAKWRDKRRKQLCKWIRSPFEPNLKKKIGTCYHPASVSDKNYSQSNWCHSVTSRETAPLLQSGFDPWRCGVRAFCCWKDTSTKKTERVRTSDVIDDSPRTRVSPFIHSQYLPVKKDVCEYFLRNPCLYFLIFGQGGSTRMSYIGLSKLNPMMSYLRGGNCCARARNWSFWGHFREKIEIFKICLPARRADPKEDLILWTPRFGQFRDIIITPPCTE